MCARTLEGSGGRDERPGPGEELNTGPPVEPRQAATVIVLRGGAEIVLVFPTIKHLEQLSDFPSVEALLAHARGREVVPVQPKVVLEGEVARILLPGEPGY